MVECFVKLPYPFRQMDPTAMLPTAASSVLPRSEMLTCWRRLKIVPTTRSSLVPLDGQVVLAWTETQIFSRRKICYYVVGWCACGCCFFDGSEVDSSACCVRCLFLFWSFAFESCCDCQRTRMSCRKSFGWKFRLAESREASSCVRPNDVSMLLPRLLGGVKLAENLI